MADDTQKITFVLTSCERFDLLEKTLASFFQHEDAKLIEHFIITEDSGKKQIYDVLEKFPQVKFEVIFNSLPKGQFTCIDEAYARVKTPYIFHCEDDWEFTKPNFIQPSLALLEDFPELVQVLIRDPAEEKHGGAAAPLIEHKGIKHRRLDTKGHYFWHGYSFNPGLRRTADQKKIGPFRFLLEENKISLRSKQLGFCQAMLENGGVKHIGKHRHVLELFSVRPRLIPRLKNSIIKRTVGFPPVPDGSKILPISCFIVAKNEEARIERALISVKALADEIIVVDSGSTDRTLEIAKSYGAKVFFNEWEGDGPQKRFAEEQCRNNWLLNIDADEWLNAALVQSIRHLFEKGEPAKPVWCLRRGDIYFGDRHLRWHMNLEKMPRLYDKRRARFTPQKLHTSVPRARGSTGVLDGVLLHAYAHSVGDMIRKEMNYAKVGMKEKSLFILLLRVLTDFPQCFLKHYFLRGHIFGGRKGFIYSMVRAYVRFLRTAMELEKKLRWIEKESQRFIPPPLPNVLSGDSIAPKIPVSGFIIAQDEAARIGRALSTMQKLGLDEIIVVDSGSTDNTREIAQSYGAKVIAHEWLGFIGSQKHFAEKQCRNQWLFNLDSDEWLNDKAIKNIRKIFLKGSPRCSAYKIGRNDLYIGRKHLFPWMKGHGFIRLYDSAKMNFKPDVVIDNIDYASSGTGRVKGRMFHTAVRSLWQVGEKENTYSDLEQSRIDKSLATLSRRLFLEMPLFFFKLYILRGMVFGGLAGFCYATIYSFARFQRIAKLLEKKSAWQE